MKESNAYRETARAAVQSFGYEKPLDAAALGIIQDLANKPSGLDQQEIRELTKLILKLDPATVDESLQAKFHQIMNKVRAQYTQSDRVELIHADSAVLKEQQ